MSLRIVIITYNWVPRNAIGTHRPYAWAKYWSALGAEITILTAVKQPFDEPLDLNLPKLHGVNVIEVAYDNKNNAFRGLLMLSFIRHLSRRVKRILAKRAGILIDPRRAWYIEARRIAINLAPQVDVVVSTYGPAHAHLLATEMKLANPRIFWLADYRDLWTQRHIDNIPDVERTRMRNQEGASVGLHANMLSAVSKDMVEQLFTAFQKPVHFSPNGFDLDEKIVRTRLSTPPVLQNGPFRIVYTGMLYDGYRDPVPLLNALAELRRSKGEIMDRAVTVDFYGDRVGVAITLAKNPEYSPFIRLMGHVSREESLNAQRTASLLLLLESPAPEARGVLTGKLFEYMVSGRPILCIGSKPEYEIGQVLKETGTGVTIEPNRYSEIASLILNTLNGKGLFSSYKPNINKILEYSRQRQAVLLFESIKKNVVQEKN